MLFTGYFSVQKRCNIEFENIFLEIIYKNYIKLKNSNKTILITMKKFFYINVVF